MTTKITEKNISNIANAAVQWQSVVTADGSTNTTAVAGEGYFINTSSATHTINLPASPSLGDVVAIVDTGSASTNNITIGRNGSNIEGAASNLTMSASKDSRILVYSGSTNGWLVQSQVKGPVYMAATGGTVTTSGDYKIHTFTSSGCFAISNAGDQDTTVEYLVVAGGGSGGQGCAGGGGGAGGYRTNYPSPDTAGFAVSAGSYPITVGAGGAGLSDSPSNNHGNSGSNSVFSTITSAGGGYGAGASGPAPNQPNWGGTGGSGGGGNWAGHSGGAGNTPPVSPSQGNPGGNSSYPGNTTPDDNAGGGGGASAAGQPGNDGFRGGAGSPNSITGSAVTYAGGGGGSHRDNPAAYSGRPGGIGTGGSGGGGTGSLGRNISYTHIAATSATANTGGGGGAGNRHNSIVPSPGSLAATGSGGSGIVIIRYKYQ